MTSNNLKKKLNKTTISWALYDWANSAFATTVMAGFFPIFFKQYWSAESNPTDTTYYLGVANSLSSFILAVSAPYLGALADASNRKKYYLSIFVFIGALSSSSLYFVGYGSWTVAIIFYAISAIGFSGGNIFYDSLLPTLTNKKNYDFVSGLGYSLGYLGGGLLFLINVYMTLKPEHFLIKSPTEAVRLSFLMVGFWWVLFSIPLFLFVKEPHALSLDTATLFKKGLKQLKNTFSELSKNKATLFFLLAYLFYIDGVNTIIKMAVDYGLSLGFDTNNLITALLITQFVGFPAAIVFGIIGEKWNPVSGIFIALTAYCFITIWGYQMDNVKEFYYMAVSIGLVQGGIQSLSRSYFAKLIPEHKEAEYFGFFNMIGKASAILGPFLVGYVSLKTQSHRTSILVILIFFLIGGALLFTHKKLKRSTSL